MNSTNYISPKRNTEQRDREWTERLGEVTKEIEVARHRPTSEREMRPSTELLPTHEPMHGFSENSQTVLSKQTSRPSTVADDDILVAGGILKKGEGKKADAKNQGNLPKTIRKEDWNHSSDQLVHALRSGEGMRLTHGDLMNLLHGRNLFGWTESKRNWIGDEMMTMLRQDIPERAFGDLRGVAENVSAPVAMRDYAIQHISHLVNDGVNGVEAVEAICKAYDSGDPAVAGTALISLYRISRQKPSLMDVAKVLEMARKSENSENTSLRITAGAILRENK